MYLATLSRRLNDVSDYFANPASHTVDLFFGNCFETCKLNQVWNDFLRNNYILWDASMHLVLQTRVLLINKSVFSNLLELLEIGLVKALHFDNLFVVIIDGLQN